jgi:hypothetical protein
MAARPTQKNMKQKRMAPSKSFGDPVQTKFIAGVGKRSKKGLTARF